MAYELTHEDIDEALAAKEGNQRPITSYELSDEDINEALAAKENNQRPKQNMQAENFYQKGLRMTAAKNPLSYNLLSGLVKGTEDIGENLVNFPRNIAERLGVKTSGERFKIPQAFDLNTYRPDDQGLLATGANFAGNLGSYLLPTKLGVAAATKIPSLLGRILAGAGGGAAISSEEAPGGRELGAVLGASLPLLGAGANIAKSGFQKLKGLSNDNIANEITKHADMAKLQYKKLYGDLFEKLDKLEVFGKPKSVIKTNKDIYKEGVDAGNKANQSGNEAFKFYLDKNRFLEKVTPEVKPIKFLKTDADFIIKNADEEYSKSLKELLKKPGFATAHKAQSDLGALVRKLKREAPGPARDALLPKAIQTRTEITKKINKGIMAAEKKAGSNENFAKQYTDIGKGYNRDVVPFKLRIKGEEGGNAVELLKRNEISNKTLVNKYSKNEKFSLNKGKELENFNRRQKIEKKIPLLKLLGIGSAGGIAAYKHYTKD